MTMLLSATSKRCLAAPVHTFKRAPCCVRRNLRGCSSSRVNASCGNGHVGPLTIESCCISRSACATNRAYRVHGAKTRLAAVQPSATGGGNNTLEVYPLEKTKVLVETAMLAAVTGLAYVLATTLKLENSVGYFLPLPILVSAMRGGIRAGFRTMLATTFLLLVLMGPIRAVGYMLMHGLLAASLGGMWRAQFPWALSVPLGAVVRMCGQLSYMVLTSWTMNENLFAIVLMNVHSLLDQISMTIGVSGAPSTLAVICMIFALMLVNGICYVLLLHVLHRVILQSMGFTLGKMPAIIENYLFAGMVKK